MSAFLMKGQKWRDRFCKGQLRFAYPAFVEPKIDDIRCRVRAVRDDEHEVLEVQFLSYAEKPLHNLGKWAECFRQFFDMFPSMSNIDCGIEVNRNFNDSYRYTRSSRGLPKEKFDKASGKTFPALDESMVVFHIFDLPDSVQDYDKRRALVVGATDALRMYGVPAEHVPQIRVNSDEAVESAYQAYRKQGYEGAMLKTWDHKYQIGKRSWDWYKLKPEDDADGVVIDFTEATATVADPDNGIAVGDGLGRIGSITVRCEDGSIASPAGIDHALGRDMFSNPGKYLDRWVEFRFMERDRAGGYRHPIFNRFREDKV